MKNKKFLTLIKKRCIGLVLHQLIGCESNIIYLNNLADFNLINLSKKFKSFKPILRKYKKFIKLNLVLKFILK